MTAFVSFSVKGWSILLCSMKFNSLFLRSFKTFSCALPTSWCECNFSKCMTSQFVCWDSRVTRHRIFFSRHGFLRWPKFGWTGRSNKFVDFEILVFLFVFLRLMQQSFSRRLLFTRVSIQTSMCREKESNWICILSFYFRIPFCTLILGNLRKNNFKKSFEQPAGPVL